MTLDLCDHARSNLTNLHDGALSIALCAGLDVADNDFAINGQLDGFSIVQVFERYLEGVVDAGSLTRAS